MIVIYVCSKLNMKCRTQLEVITRQRFLIEKMTSSKHRRLEININISLSLVVIGHRHSQLLF